MPKFKVLVSRTVQEQVWVEVESEKQEWAGEMAEAEVQDLPRERWDVIDTLSLETIETEEM